MSQPLVSSFILDDTSSNITYSGNWTHGANVEADYNLYNNTDSFSGEQGATATLHFYGTSVAYWGNLYNTHGRCQVALDGNNVSIVDSYQATRGDPEILFGQDGLQLKDHTLSITVLDNTTINRCEVDRFDVNITTAGTATSATVSFPLVSSTASPTAVSKSKSSAAAIAGGFLGGISFLCIVVFALWWHRRSNRNMHPAPTAFDPDAAEQKPHTTVPTKATYTGTAASTGAASGSGSGVPTGTATTAWRPSTDFESTISPQIPFHVLVFQQPPPAYDEQ